MVDEPRVRSPAKELAARGDRYRLAARGRQRSRESDRRLRLIGALVERLLVGVRRAPRVALPRQRAPGLQPGLDHGIQREVSRGDAIPASILPRNDLLGRAAEKSEP